ncbi:MAG: hypothetical protein Athens101426_550 [Parcubacteria group bacterium Athens1014_26]|nr:MAG: hypothetical protein Athens101426_550 [Parcubacteria group bacterium Athens1014_26]
MKINPASRHYRVGVYDLGDSELVLNTGKAGAESSGVGVWARLDDAISSYGHCGVLDLEKRFGSQGCKDCSRYIYRPASTQYSLVNHFLRPQKSRLGFG